MLKVLNSKVCEKRTKACVKALKKVKKKKTSPTSHSHKHTHKHKDTNITHKHKHTKHRHKHKTTHGNHHNISIKIGSDKKTSAPVVAPATPFTPNPPPSGFVNYQQPAGATSVNRNDLVALQKEFQNGLTKLRAFWKKNDNKRPNPADKDESVNDKTPPLSDEEFPRRRFGDGSGDPDNTRFETGNLGPD